jgi:hypothetical protein
MLYQFFHDLEKVQPVESPRQQHRKNVIPCFYLSQKTRYFRQKLSDIENIFNLMQMSEVKI